MRHAGRIGPGWAARLWASRRIGAELLAIVLLAVVLPAAFSSFNGTTASSGAFNGATVSLSDNDNLDALKLFNFSGLKPGDTSTACIKVSYAGNIPATVRMYGATTGSGLDQFLDLTVTRGTIGAGNVGDCSTFVADTADFYALGAGRAFNGTV